MIKEDYVSFEVAKLLKEKGFESSEPTCINVFKGHIYKIHDNKIIADDDITIPTLQMAMKWLRKFHKLGIIGKPYITGEGIFYLFEIKEMNKDFVVNKKTKTGFDTYEQACEAAIKYCLENLI